MKMTMIMTRATQEIIRQRILELFCTTSTSWRGTPKLRTYTYNATVYTSMRVAYSLRNLSSYLNRSTSLFVYGRASYFPTSFVRCYVRIDDDDDDNDWATEDCFPRRILELFSSTRTSWRRAPKLRIQCYSLQFDACGL